jgi:hypothetical protein
MYGGEMIPTGFWWENLRERGHLEALGIGGRKYKMDPKKQDGRILWIDWIQHRDKRQARDHTDEHSGFIKFWEFLD